MCVCGGVCGCVVDDSVWVCGCVECVGVWACGGVCGRVVVCVGMWWCVWMCMEGCGVCRHVSRGCGVCDCMFS